MPAVKSDIKINAFVSGPCEGMEIVGGGEHGK